MSTPDAVIRRWFEEVWNQSSSAASEKAIERLMTPSTVVHGLPQPEGPGPPGFKGLFRQFKGAFPDLHVEVVRTVAQDRSVVGLCRVTGTHTGSELGGAPTGRKVDFQGLVLMDTDEERMVEAWNFFDFPTMNRQLGLAPEE
jgi:predicted ester cyclase